MKAAPPLALRVFLLTAILVNGFLRARAAEPNEAFAAALSFYASFDRSTSADFGRGDLRLWTRYDHPSQQGRTTAEVGYDHELVKLDSRSGAHGGSLHLTDVLPRNGFLFYRAGEKLAVHPGGWGGTASVWIKADPSALKTSHCDPIQIVEKRYFDGAIWCDFDDNRPRDLRLGLFGSLRPGESPPPEARQPIALAKNPPFAPQAWHHLAITWANIGSGQKNAVATLYLDGRAIADLPARQVDIEWNLDNVRFYLGAALIGWIDEAALFNRPLSAGEVSRLAGEPDLVAKVIDLARGHRP